VGEFKQSFSHKKDLRIIKLNGNFACYRSSNRLLVNIQSTTFI